MIVKLYNDNKYVLVKSFNETYYYREIMRLKLNHKHQTGQMKQLIQHKINFFLLIFNDTIYQRRI